MLLHSFFREDLQTAELLQSIPPNPIPDELTDIHAPTELSLI